MKRQYGLLRKSVKKIKSDFYNYKIKKSELL